MASHNLALVFENDNQSRFLLVKQPRPPKFENEEYDSFVDSDLWDLPSTKLDSREGELEPAVLIKGAEAVLEKIDLRKFDIGSAVNKVLEQVGFKAGDVGEWRFLKFAEEAEFGPGLPVHTVYIAGKLEAENQSSQEFCKWMSIQNCLSSLLTAKPSSDRVGPLVVVGLINELVPSPKQKFHTTLNCQEYPPGLVIVPMKSKTAKPFLTTNLVIFAPVSISNEFEDSSFLAHGDALIVDPGCRSDIHGELMEIIAALSGKLFVFVTHHHRDHVDVQVGHNYYSWFVSGLSIIQKCNPNATLLAHENTMRRIGKGDWSLGYISVSGGEDICIGGQRLKFIFAPGHTDGHMALLHVSTHSLIVGDHCVGQGSSLLDSFGGGNMTDYFETTYKFIELAPHSLIPMHGRVNMWPKHMLCAYLKNRRSREASIVKAIENGANTLFDIVANVYSGVDRSLWFHASSNVKLHVDHLAHEDKLPKEFSIQKFRKTCGFHFISRWLWAYLVYKNPSIYTILIIAGGALTGSAVFWSLKNQFSSSL